MADLVARVVARASIPKPPSPPPDVQAQLWRGAILDYQWREDITYLGEVHEAGGGIVDVTVDRDLTRYPERGARVYVGHRP